MEWLTQNWVWVAAGGAVLAILFMQRRGSGAQGGHGGGCCGGHSAHGEKRDSGGDAGAMRQSGTSSGHRH